MASDSSGEEGTSKFPYMAEVIMPRATRRANWLEAAAPREGPVAAGAQIPMMPAISAVGRLRRVRLSLVR